MTVVHITLDGVPIAKGRPRLSARGGIARVHTDAKTLAYEKRLKAEARAAMGAKKPLDGPLRLQVVAILPIPPSWSKKAREAAQRGETQPLGRPDLDNFIKITDALNGKIARGDRPAEPGIVWNDDSQVVEILARKRYGTPPRLEIRVETITDDNRLL